MAVAKPYLALAAMLAITGLAYAPAAEAGRSCEMRTPKLADMEKAVATATRLHHSLENGTADLVLLGRVGSDLSAYGLKYTHAGLARRLDDGRWQVVHQLNQCGSATSRLYTHGLLEFMMDDPYGYDVLVITPSPALQRELRRQLDSGTPARLHQPHYNMLAYPGGAPKYQNSNQWVLEVLAQAQEGTAGHQVRNRHQSLKAYQRRGFQGSEIRLSPMKRLFGGFRANVRFDDHPREARRAGRFETVTVKSLQSYLHRSGDLAGTREINGPA